jgi:hypothetical protein
VCRKRRMFHRVSHSVIKTNSTRAGRAETSEFLTIELTGTRLKALLLRLDAPVSGDRSGAAIPDR